MVKSVRLSATISLVLIATSTAHANTAVNLTAHGIFAGYDVRALTAADINGDGKADLIGANVNGNAVSVHLNTTARGAVEPTFAAGVDFASGATPVSVAAADVNGDGKSDLLVANFLDGTVSVLLNTTASGAASPSFAALQTFGINAGADSAICVIAADINGDGKPDIIVANESATTLAVLINTTTPGANVASFAPAQTFPGESYPMSVVAADINGDGKLDLVIAASNNNEVSVLLNTMATGSVVAAFAQPQAFATAPGTVAAAIASADINADGRPDLIVANALDNSVSVLLNTTAQAAPVVNFAAPQSFTTGANAIGVVAGDIDGDGKPDIVVANDYGGSISVLIDTTPAGAASASFASQQVFIAGAFPFAPIVVDINGDGSEDVIAADNAREAVSVLLNTLVNPDQHGITGSWFNPATGGQGFEIEVYPDAIAPGHGSLFAGWFTYDVTVAGGRRWYGLTGDVSNANVLGALQIFDVEGGSFDAPPALGAHAVLGQATIRFSDCNTGSLSNAISDGSGRSGTIPLE